MNEGISKALEIFAELVKKIPRWAEAHNKQATALYLLGNARLTTRFARWSSTQTTPLRRLETACALRGPQLEKWPAALDAARQALRLQPRPGQP